MGDGEEKGWPIPQSYRTQMATRERLEVRGGGGKAKLLGRERRGRGASVLTDPEFFALTCIDRRKGSTFWDLTRWGTPSWAWPSRSFIDRLAERNLVTISGDERRIHLTDAGRQALRPSQRLFSVYARERHHLSCGDREKALDAAAAKSDADMVAWLLAAGANPNGAYPAFRTPLETAAVYGQTEVARLLVTRGAEVNLRGKDGWGPLMHAAWYGRTEIIRLILSARPALTLLEAAAVGDREVVRHFLQNGASPDDTGGSANRWTPLDMALRGGHTPVVGLLLDAGATIHKAPDLTPLDVAAESGHPETVAYLLDRTGDSRALILSALSKAAEARRLEVVRLLLDRGADPNALDGRILIRAAGWGNTAIARELLEHGAMPTQAVVEQVISIFAEPEVGETPETMALLLEFGADPHAALEAALAHDELDEPDALDGTIGLLRKAVDHR